MHHSHAAPSLYEHTTNAFLYDVGLTFTTTLVSYLLFVPGIVLVTKEPNARKKIINPTYASPARSYSLEATPPHSVHAAAHRARRSENYFALARLTLVCAKLGHGEIYSRPCCHRHEAWWYWHSPRQRQRHGCWCCWCHWSHWWWR